MGVYHSTLAPAHHEHWCGEFTSRDRGAEERETLLENLEERFDSFLVELAEGEPGVSFPFPEE